MEDYELEVFEEAMQTTALFKALIGEIKTLLEDKETQSSINDLTKLVAKMTKNSVEAFQAEDFSREEAITLTAAMLSKAGTSK